jgi:hypothetical protein
MSEENEEMMATGDELAAANQEEYKLCISGLQQFLSCWLLCTTACDGRHLPRMLNGGKHWIWGDGSHQNTISGSIQFAVQRRLRYYDPTRCMEMHGSLWWVGQTLE